MRGLIGDVGEEVEPGDDALGVLTRDLHRGGQLGAGGDHDGLVPLGLEVGQVADTRVALDLDTQRCEVRDVGIDDLVREAVGRDGVTEESARLGALLGRRCGLHGVRHGAVLRGPAGH